MIGYARLKRVIIVEALVIQRGQLVRMEKHWLEAGGAPGPNSDRVLVRTDLDKLCWLFPVDLEPCEGPPTCWERIMAFDL